METKKIKKGLIYKIEVDGELLYIGSTMNLSRRKSDHKSRCFNDSDKRYNQTLYQTIRSKNITRETFKERVKMLWICNVEFVERYELGAVEAHYIKEFQPVCNCETPYGKEWDQKQYHKQYYQDNKGKMKQYHKQYYQDNKDNKDKRKVYQKQYHKQYYQDNKDKRKEYQKQYNQDNKDEIKQRQKKYRKSDKSKKYCIFCKHKYRKSPKDFYKHTKTDKHKRNTTIFREDVIDTIECRLIQV
jgi:hypothetical protein